jgi:predicted O-linked N-acetylglucosamine transferase (SPINDLY family)
MLLAQFAAQGIGADRLLLEAHLPQAEALAAYNRIDIALDPFPYGGTTTTAEALWMGVPVVTLCGERWVTRVSQSILATVGLRDWVAETIEAYVETACRLAADLPHLTGLRADLRRRLESSAFCDGPRFTKSLEAAFRGMWTACCAGPPAQ